MKRWSWLMAIALSVSMLGFAGCEDDDDDDEGSTTTTTTGGTTTGGTTTGGTTTGDTTPAEPDNANVAGNWNGPQIASGGTAHFNVSLTQDAEDVVRGTFNSPDISASGKVGGTVSGGDHVVLTFQYLVGAVAGYMETWDGHVNAAVNDFTGTVTPNNGSPAGTFALQK